jgi:CRISPR-associated endonuclease/helicase Cas3
MLSSELEQPDYTCFAEGNIDGEPSALWLVLRLPQALSDSVAAQEIALVGSKQPVVRLLTDDGHEESVARRAAALSRHLGLGELLARELQVAGRHHDDGKKDLRFQDLLRYGSEKPAAKVYVDDSSYWAKSRRRSASWEHRFRNEHNLSGWRHEQRSVAEYAAAEERHDDELDQRLVLRLIGTSHGHGRSAFSDNSERLIPPAVIAASKVVQTNIEEVRDAARKYFDEGGWETIIAQTNREYGFWGSAYIETILRSADVTISSEGR